MVDYISVFFIPVLSHAKENNDTNNPPFECEKCKGTFVIKTNQQSGTSNESKNTDWVKNLSIISLEIKTKPKQHKKLKKQNAKPKKKDTKPKKKNAKHKKQNAKHKKKNAKQKI